jgi:hypothetical protein
MTHTTTARNVEFQTSGIRRSLITSDISVLTDIYQEDVNIAVWQNQLPSDVLKSIDTNMLDQTRLQIKVSVSPNDVIEELIASSSQLGNQKALCEYIELLVEMFCTLFELKRVGLRLVKLDQAMCPKFHVDKVPCRLVTTLSGIATEWLPHDQVDRSKLGAGSQNLPDEISGIMKDPSNIQHLKVGDLALLKGEGWYNNENCGLVHRSPAVANNNQRLLLTLDFIE